MSEGSEVHDPVNQHAVQDVNPLEVLRLLRLLYLAPRARA